MNIRQSSVATAKASWGTAPDWVMALAAHADDLKSQSSAGKTIGYSGPAVNCVLKNNYKGDLSKIETVVRGALLRETANCIVFGKINLKECLDYQDKKRLSGASIGVQIRKACPKCPHQKKEKSDDK